jgi:hypothetical protein
MAYSKIYSRHRKPGHSVKMTSHIMYPDEDLVKRAVKNARSLKPGPTPRWVAVKETFASDRHTLKSYVYCITRIPDEIILTQYE